MPQVFPSLPVVPAMPQFMGNQVYYLGSNKAAHGQELVRGQFHSRPVVDYWSVRKIQLLPLQTKSGGARARIVQRNWTPPFRQSFLNLLVLMMTMVDFMVLLTMMVVDFMVLMLMMMVDFMLVPLLVMILG